MPAPTVLVVDDDPDALDLVEDALADAEVRTLRANSGPEAFAVLMSAPVDVVVLDIGMPDMNGYALLEVIRFVPRLAKIAVIVCTAHTSRLDAARAEELRAVRFLPKPISPDSLRQQVFAVLPGAVQPVRVRA